MRNKKIPAELHILSEGAHGFGLGVNNKFISSVDTLGNENFMFLTANWI